MFSILTGSYNSTIQLWSTDGKIMTTLNGHAGAVKAVEWIGIEKSINEKNEKSSNIYKFISTSHDQTVIIWHWNQSKGKLEKTEKCVGHTESVDCVSINSDKTKFVTGSWDKMLKLWNIGIFF
jgi:ribosome biogenesis protein